MRTSDSFVFDTQVIAQAIAFDQRVVEVPIRTRYHAEAPATSIHGGIVYGAATLATVGRRSRVQNDPGLSMAVSRMWSSGASGPRSSAPSTLIR